MSTTAASQAVISATRQATVRAMLLVLVGALGVQLSAVIAVGLFEPLGVLGTSSLRLFIAAIVLLAIFRPKLRGRSRADWLGIVLYGITMATMNAFLYLAFARLPLGIVTTIDFMGPCLVALFTSRRLREGALALVALIGVGLIAGFGGEFDALGLLFAALAGASFGAYTLLAARVGQQSGGLGGMALSVTVGALITLPISVPAMSQVQPGHLVSLVASALLGTTLAFTVDTMAGKLTSARVLGVFFAFDPVLGTILGALFLGQFLTPIALLGMALVIGAGAGIVWFAGSDKQRTPATPA